MSFPTSFSAAESNSFSYVFYAREGSDIAFLKSDTTREGNKTKYTSASITVNSKSVSPVSTKLSAVAYEKDGKQIRVYYVRKQPNGNNFKLCELCRTDVGSQEGKWTDGALNGNSISCSRDSPISANVANDQGDLKVYYVNENGQPGVAWVVLGQEAWASHELTGVDW